MFQLSLLECSIILLTRTQECATNHYAYKFESFTNAYSDTSLWGCYGVTPRDHTDDFIHVLQTEWIRIATVCV